MICPHCNLEIVPDEEQERELEEAGCIVCERCGVEVQA